MLVAPGDIVVGDEDGVVCVPQTEAEALLAQTAAIRQREDRTMREILDGTVDRSWVDAQLKARGFSG
jgi:regulator of RNase E activity RraA